MLSCAAFSYLHVDGQQQLRPIASHIRLCDVMALLLALMTPFGIAFFNDSHMTVIEFDSGCSHCVAALVILSLCNVHFIFIVDSGLNSEIRVATEYCFLLHTGLLQDNFPMCVHMSYFLSPPTAP